MPDTTEKKRVSRKRTPVLKAPVPKAQTWIDVAAIFANNTHTHTDTARCIQMIGRLLIGLLSGGSGIYCIEKFLF